MEFSSFPKLVSFLSRGLAHRRITESGFLEEEGFLLDNSCLVFQSVFLFQPQNQDSREKPPRPTAQDGSAKRTHQFEASACTWGGTGQLKPPMPVC